MGWVSIFPGFISTGLKLLVVGGDPFVLETVFPLLDADAVPVPDVEAELTPLIDDALDELEPPEEDEEDDAKALFTSIYLFENAFAFNQFKVAQGN